MITQRKRVFAHLLPVEAAFAYDSPRVVASKYHQDGKPRQEFMYTCVVGDPIYADAKLHKAICAVKPRKGEPIVICREERQSESTGRAYNVWHVSRPTGNTSPASPPPGPANGNANWTQARPQGRGSAGQPAGNGDNTPPPSPGSRNQSAPANGQAANGGTSNHSNAPSQRPGADPSSPHPDLTPEEAERRRLRQAHNEALRDRLVKSRGWANQASLDLAKQFAVYAEKINLRNGSGGDTVRMTEQSIAAAATSLFIEYRKQVR